MIVKNFLFHRVSDDIDLLWPPMKPELFERIIKKISNQYEVVNLEYYLNNKSCYNKSKKPLATILFDDGYKDNIEYAAPILKKYNCPASFYVVTDCIDKNIPTWTYILDYTFQNTIAKSIQLNFDYVPTKFKTLFSGHLTVRNFKPWLKTVPNSQRLSIIESIRLQTSDVNIPNNQMMNWNEVKQLANSGFEIGSHTHTHPMLAHILDEKEIEKELKTSFDIIQHRLGKSPETISYPIGSYDDRVMKLSKKQGYKWGLAVDQKFFNCEKDNFFSIPRVELYQQPWFKVNSRITGIHSMITKIWK